MMESTRIQNGQTERVEVLALDSSGDPITGLTDVLLLIRRTSDGYFLDFDDNTFKASGWVDIDKVMTEIDATNDAGKYKYNFDTSGFSDDTYELRSTCASASNFPQVGEVKVGDYVDNLDAPVSKIEDLVSGKMLWDSANSRFKIYDQSDALKYYLYVKDKDDNNVVMTGTGPVQRNVKVEAV